MLEPQAQAAALQQPRAEHPAPCQQPAQVQELLHVNGIESAEGPERPPRPLRHAEYGPLSASLRAIQEGLELERYGAEVVELRAEVWALSAALLQAHEVAARRAVQVQEQENWASLRLYMAEVNFHAVHAGMAAEAEALRRSLAVEARKGQREAESKAALEQELQAVAGAKERAVTELTQQNAELNDILRAQIESGQQHVQKVQRQYLEDIWELQQSMERDRTLLLGVRDRETALQQETVENLNNDMERLMGQMGQLRVGQCCARREEELRALRAANAELEQTNMAAQQECLAVQLERLTRERCIQELQAEVLHAREDGRVQELQLTVEELRLEAAARKQELADRDMAATQLEESQAHLDRLLVQQRSWGRSLQHLLGLVAESATATGVGAWPDSPGRRTNDRDVGEPRDVGELLDALRAVVVSDLIPLRYADRRQLLAQSDAQAQLQCAARAALAQQETLRRAHVQAQEREAWLDLRHSAHAAWLVRDHAESTERLQTRLELEVAQGRRRRGSQDAMEQAQRVVRQELVQRGLKVSQLEAALHAATEEHAAREAELEREQAALREQLRAAEQAAQAARAGLAPALVDARASAERADRAEAELRRLRAEEDRLLVNNCQLEWEAERARAASKGRGSNRGLDRDRDPREPRAVGADPAVAQLELKVVTMTGEREELLDQMACQIQANDAEVRRLQEQVEGQWAWEQSLQADRQALAGREERVVAQERALSEREESLSQERAARERSLAEDERRLAAREREVSEREQSVMEVSRLSADSAAPGPAAPGADSELLDLQRGLRAQQEAWAAERTRLRQKAHLLALREQALAEQHRASGAWDAQMEALLRRTDAELRRLHAALEAHQRQERDWEAAGRLLQEKEELLLRKERLLGEVDWLRDQERRAGAARHCVGLQAADVALRLRQASGWAGPGAGPEVLPPGTVAAVAHAPGAGGYQTAPALHTAEAGGHVAAAAGATGAMVRGLRGGAPQEGDPAPGAGGYAALVPQLRDGAMYGGTGYGPEAVGAGHAGASSRPFAAGLGPAEWQGRPPTVVRLTQPAECGWNSG